MPKKPLTPEAAQRKVWMTERKTIAANIRKIERDAAREGKRLGQEINKLLRRIGKIDRAAERELAAAHRRLAILNGRLGLA